jgi:CheY-like chemotaxis protein
MEGDREECIRAGCDSYAVKPIDRVELVTRLASYLKLPEPEV